MSTVLRRVSAILAVIATTVVFATAGLAQMPGSPWKKGPPLAEIWIEPRLASPENLRKELAGAAPPILFPLPFPIPTAGDALPTDGPGRG